MHLIIRRSPLLFALLLSCSWFTGPKITDEIVQNYVKAYIRLKAAGPELAERMKNAQGKEIEIDQGMAGYAEIERIIKESGFKSYREFVQVNAKIGLAFSQLEGRQFLNEMDQMHAIGNEEIDKQLADPEVPEETKAELRRAKAQIEASMNKNKPWAEGVMKGAELVGDKETLDVVRRHAKEIRDAYTGGIAQPGRQFFGRDLQ